MWESESVLRLNFTSTDLARNRVIPNDTEESSGEGKTGVDGRRRYTSHD